MNRLSGLAICVLLVGCFTLQPTGGSRPEAGQQVAFDVNDHGRVALGGSMGPEISQIEGTLLEASNGEYVIAVSAVRFLRAAEQRWSGEKVRIKPEHLGAVYERRFSPGRSVALGAVTIGGITAFLLTRNIVGRGTSDRPPVPRDTGDAMIIRP